MRRQGASESSAAMSPGAADQEPPTSPVVTTNGGEGGIFQRRQPAMQNLRKISLSFLIVGAFFVLVEAVLWASGTKPLLAEADPFAGFSRSVRVFEEVPSRGVLATAPRASRLSFNHQEFSRRKPEGGLRIFTLGGSSAYGFPYGAEVAFTKLLGDALGAALPGTRVEAVNASGMSYGSHRLRILAHELAAYEPDIFVVYEGHNEFIERSFYRELLARREGLDPLRKALHAWRLYSFLTRLLVTPRLGAGQQAFPPAAGNGSGGAPSPADGDGALLGFDVERDHRGRIGESQRAEVLDRFEENLSAIVDIAGEAGAKVVLCTVATNIRDWRPNQSLFPETLAAETRDRITGLVRSGSERLEAGDPARALEAIEEARILAPTHAEAHFLAGRALEALERWDEAGFAYRFARDTDGQPARATTSLNDAIRRVATAKGAHLVEIERRFEEASPHGLVGFNLLEDYVHPTPEGHRQIALELYRSLLESGLAGEKRAADPELFVRALEEAAAEDPRRPAPLASAPSADLLFNLAVVLKNQGQLDRAIEKYRQLLTIEPAHFPARCNLGWLLYQAGRLDSAEAEFREAIEGGSSHLNCLVGLGRTLSALGRPGESEEIFRRATEIEPDSAVAWTGLGSALAEEGQLTEAIDAFRIAVARDDEDPDALANLGQALLQSGQIEEAIPLLRASLALRHDHRRARLALAAAFVQSANYDEAERLYRAALASDPTDAWAREGLDQIQSLRDGR